MPVRTSISLVEVSEEECFLQPYTILYHSYSCHSCIFRLLKSCRTSRLVFVTELRQHKDTKEPLKDKKKPGKPADAADVDAINIQPHRRQILIVAERSITLYGTPSMSKAYQTRSLAKQEVLAVEETVIRTKACLAFL